MVRDNEFYTIKEQEKRILIKIENSGKDLEYEFGIFKKEGHLLIGTISLFQVLRGSLQSAFIGYFLDKEHNGMGYTTDAVKLLVGFAFKTLKLHRIEAGVMPHNIGSIRVLEPRSGRKTFHV